MKKKLKKNLKKKKKINVQKCSVRYFSNFKDRNGNRDSKRKFINSLQKKQ